MCYAGTNFAANIEAKLMLFSGQTNRPTGETSDHTRYCLAEGLALTCRIITEEPANVQLQTNLSLSQRQVSHSTLVAAMHTLGTGMTRRASNGLSCRCEFNVRISRRAASGQKFETSTRWDKQIGEH